MDIENIKNHISEHKNGIIGQDTEYTKYSVVIPLIEIDGKVNILFEVRSKKMRSQPGEISLPGGKMEKDESGHETAIRETCEEIGIADEDIRLLGPTDVLITQHYKIIHTYAAYIKNTSQFRISEAEVDHIFFVPLDFFIENKPVSKNIRIISEPEEQAPYEYLENTGQYKWIVGRNKVYFYKYKDYIIWGITAKIIHNFIDIISKKEA